MALRRFEDKIVLVTASSTGIGFAISERLASEGATVIISSRKKENVDQAVSEITKQGFKAIGFPCNVSKPEDRKALFNFIHEKWGRLDVLVPNAATSLHFGMSVDTPEKAYDKMFETNVKSIFQMITEYLPLLQKSKTANICITSSYTAYSNSNLIGVYGVTKTTLLGLTKMFATEFMADDIRVNCVCPGLIRTKFAKALLESENAATVATGAKRPGEPREIAGCVAFLTSQDASYMTGESLLMTGAVSSRL